MGDEAVTDAEIERFLADRHDLMDELAASTVQHSRGYRDGSWSRFRRLNSARRGETAGPLAAIRP